MYTNVNLAAPIGVLAFLGTASFLLVADLPADVRNPVLLINEGEWVTHLVIGHENSLWHKKTAFQM